jgi:putative Holliday junction resolvase
MVSRLLAIDYGEKRIGLAITDPMQMFAKPLETFPNLSEENTFKYLNKLIAEKNIARIIIGVPWSLDGNETAKTKEILDFIEKLKAVVNVPVEGFDERFTTSDANDLLREMGLNWKQSRLVIDALAACLILKNYLESNSDGSDNGPSSQRPEKN